MGQDVFIVEHREFITLVSGSIWLDTVVAHVASTKQKAIDWCKANLDYDRPENGWWFYCYRDEVDTESNVMDCEPFTMDKHGNMLVDKQLPDYAHPYVSC